MCIRDRHQLRGRVGRGGEQSYCFLLGEAPNEESAARLEALVASNDGFALAEVDLDLRGEGTLLGARQRGRSDLKLASLRDDQDLLFMAHDAATKLVGPSDDLSEHPDLVDELRLFIDDEEADYLFKSCLLYTSYRRYSVFPATRVTPRLHTGRSGLTTDDPDLLAHGRSSLARRHVPVRPRSERATENPFRQVCGRSPLHGQPPPGPGKSQPGRPIGRARSSLRKW